MSYGLLVNGNDGSDFLLIDSTLNHSAYAIVQFATGSSFTVPSTTGTGLRVFVKKSGGVSVGLDPGILTANTINTFKSADGTQNGTTETVDYFLAIDMANATVSGTYGLQIFTSTQAVAFDSRRYNINKNFQVLESTDAGTVSGNTGTVMTVTNADTFYYDVTGTFFDRSTSGDSDYMQLNIPNGTGNVTFTGVTVDPTPIYWVLPYTVLRASVYP